MNWSSTVNYSSLIFIIIVTLLPINYCKKDTNKNQRTFHVAIWVPFNRSFLNDSRNHLKIIKSNVQPIIDLAIKHVQKNDILPVNLLKITFKDSQQFETNRLSSEAMFIDRPDCIIGYATNDEMEPVAKTSWLYKNESGVPVITTVGLNDQFSNKTQYKLLTRMNGDYRQMAKKFFALFKNVQHRSLKFAYLVQDNIVNQKKFGRHECYYQTADLLRENELLLNSSEKIGVIYIDPQIHGHNEIREILANISMEANVIVICGAPTLIHKIMLIGHDLGITQSGQYVFVNIDFSVKSDAITKYPWYRREDSQDQNNIAREVFKALKMISLRKSQRFSYYEFEKKVQRIAERNYNYSQMVGQPYELSPFITAFYDAILLYSIAINQTIADGSNLTSGFEVTRRMWNRTFESSTGNIYISANGDRKMDYSMMGYDHETNQFMEKAYWLGTEDRWVQAEDFSWFRPTVRKSKNNMKINVVY